MSRRPGAGVLTLVLVLGGLAIAAGCGGPSRPSATAPAAGDGAAGGTGEETRGDAGATRDGGDADSDGPASADAGAGAEPPTGSTGAPAGGGTAGGDLDDGAPAGGPTAAPAEPNHREVVLFFQRDDDDTLGPERRRILLTPSVADQARQIVSELAAGPELKDLLPTVPRQTTVLGVYLDRRGTAFVDLSDEFISMHPGGSADEMATVFSIVDSLTYNLPEVRRVRFLVGGEERETLHSHLDLRRAYLKDMSIVRMEEGG